MESDEEEQMQPEENFLVLLRGIFPRTNEQMIQNVIQLVEEANPYDTFEGKVENMVNMLSGEGALGPMPNIPTQENLKDRLLADLITIFGEVDEDYLREYVAGKPDDFDFEEAIEELASRNLPNKSVDPIIIGDQLRAALPNADPSYLQEEAHKLAERSPEEIDAFLQNAIEKNEYPTMQEYLMRKKHDDEVALYKDNFNMSKFLETIPNPVEKFTDPNRKLILDENCKEHDERYALNFLYNHYRFIRRKYIDILFVSKRKNLVTICDRLEKLSKSMKKPRPLVNGDDSTNIDLLKLITYLKYRKSIKHALKAKDEDYRHAKEEARKYNLLETCQCCFDDELIPEECYFCMKECVFCKSCIQKGVEVGIGRGDVKFPCMTNCNSEFSLQTLQMVLPAKMFERLAQRISSEEIKKANVDGLETCPFCEFAMVLPEDEKIFRCVNEECLKESCRQCRHESHIPLRCNEIEYDEDVRRRTFIENKMTEALTRKCYKCQKLFVKSNGCNKMTCNCGAKMCYLCGAAIDNYSHFGDGGGRCALFTNDVEVNLQRVLTGAQAAKNELGDVELKFDPTANIREFFK